MQEQTGAECHHVYFIRIIVKVDSQRAGNIRACFFIINKIFELRSIDAKTQAVIFEEIRKVRGHKSRDLAGRMGGIHGWSPSGRVAGDHKKAPSPIYLSFRCLQWLSPRL